MTDKIAVIGFGNIASAIVTPLLDNKLIQPENVFCVVNTEKSLEKIKNNYKHNINVYKSGSKESKIVWDCQYKLLSEFTTQKTFSGWINFLSNRGVIIAFAIFPKPIIAILSVTD